MYTYSSLDSYVHYWENTDFEELQRKLFAQLSEELIEVPYADKPKEYEYRFEKVAFHPNHGSAHAIRLVILFDKYLRLVQSSHLPTVPTLSQEEKACLSLAMFLFRSGRTNEIGWDGDTSYSNRSAFIFTHIAKTLGYSTELVEVIAQCFDYKARIPLTTGFYGKSLINSNVSTLLYQSLFQLAHNSDLVRCHEKYSHLKSKLTNALNKLKQLFGSLDTGSVDDHLLFAAQCCVATGTPVTVRELHERSGGSFIGNPSKMVHTANNVIESLRTLATMSNMTTTKPDDTPEEADLYESTDLPPSTTDKPLEPVSLAIRFFSNLSSPKLELADPSVICRTPQPKIT
jgi:hypothetical protein